MKFLKPFNQLDEIRQSDLNPNLKRLIDLGIAEEELEWKVEYDEDTKSMESSDKQRILAYRSPTSAHITKVEGVIEAFQTQLSIHLSDEDQIRLHIIFSQHPGDKGRAVFDIRHGGGSRFKWHSLFGHRSDQSEGKAEEWLDKVEDSGSSIQPIFYYYEEFLKTLNEGLNITTNEMMKPDYTRLQLFIRALRDLPIDSNIILKIRQLINNLVIDPYHNRITILAEVDHGFSDIPGISELVAKFSRPLIEALEIQPHQEAEITQMGITLANFKRLAEIGVIEDSVYRHQFKKLAVSFNKLIKGLRLNVSDQTDLDLLMSLRQKAGQDSLVGLETAGAKALLAKGLHLVSSPTQLVNGSLIFSLASDYKRRNGWGIGFFPGPKVIRRMTPKGINIGVWSRASGSMDIVIKHFKDTPTDADFYNKAMLWAADNIDFEHAALYPEQSQWKYYKKKKNSPTTRSESDELRVQATALESKFRITPYQSDADRLAALELYLEASKLRLKASQLDNDEAAVISANERITHVEIDMARLRHKLNN